MFKSPFETTAIPPISLPALLKDVETARTEGNLVSGVVPDAPGILAILGDADIPELAHPFTFTSVVDKQLYTVVDLRPWRAQVRQIGASSLELPNSGPVPFNLMRARLQQLWNKPNAPDLFNLSPFPQTIFANWVGDALGSRLSLDIETTISIQAIAAFWYQCQFEEGPQRTLSESDAVLYAKVVERATRIPMARVTELLMGYGKTITKSAEFIEAIKTIGSVRIRQASLGLLYTILATSWRATIAVREVVGVAIEYPPTFIAMVWAAAHEKTYRDTPIAQLTNRYGRDGNATKFTANLGLTLKENED